MENGRFGIAIFIILIKFIYYWEKKMNFGGSGGMEGLLGRWLS